MDMDMIEAGNQQVGSVQPSLPSLLAIARPIPKPRKSLMNNNTKAISQSVATAEEAAFIPDAEGIRFPLYNNRTPPPPRTAFSSSTTYPPLPSLPKIDLTVTKMTQTDCANGLNKIYPLLEDLPIQKAAQSSKQATFIPMDAVSSNLSDFSDKDYHSTTLDSPTTIKSSVDYSSCELSQEEFQFDGESVCFSGWIQLAPQGIIKQKKKAWAMLQNNQFFISQNDESDTPIFGPYNMGKCLFVGKAMDTKSREITSVFHDSSNRKQLKMSFDNKIIILRFKPEENGEFWLPLLAKCCSQKNQNLLDASMSMLECFGKLWIKQGICGQWIEGCAFVLNRILHYSIQETCTEVDIRKIILVKRKDIPLTDWCTLAGNSTQGPLLISMEGNSLYFQADNDQCTTLWLELLRTELNKPSDFLEDCRLTSEDVPVIVDKCIRLISTYGLCQQGIYRKNGSAAEAKKLVQAFREDPYSVHLKSPITDETVFAVCGVLRTFFRQLNSPMVPADLHERLYQISNLHSADKAKFYQKVICSLPNVYFKTLRKLLGHLQEVISHESRNLASLDNISKIFGPTLFSVSNSDEEVSVDWYALTTKQTLVMRDLIFHYCDIFGVTVDELLTKCKLDVIQEQKSSKNPATGLLLPIHMFERDNKCFNIQSEWTANQVVSFKTEKLPFVSPVENYALFEMLREGQLERRIGANESLRSIVLGRWLDWEDSQESFLLLKKDLHPFQPKAGRAFADDIKIAEPGSKAFRSASLRMEEGTRISYFTKSLKKQNEWKLDEMLWFSGAETDRKAPLPFALTFFVSTEKKAAKCKGKLPGYCVVFRDQLQRHQWLNCICLNQPEYLEQPLIQI